MTSRRHSMLRRPSTAVLSLLIAGSLSASEGDYAALVAERQDGFSAMGAAAKVFRDQLRGDAPLDFDEQVEAAAVIAGHAEQIVDWFPEGSGPEAYETDARPYVWRNREKFDRLAEALGPRAQALGAAAARADRDAVLGAFRTMGGTCGDCHDSFRAD